MKKPLRQCFVIAPIGSPRSAIRKRSDLVLDRILRPALAECGYYADRADELNSPGMITTQMINRIMNDPLAIADLTGHNPNVFYEIAIRHSVQKPIVLLIEEGEEIPFDIAGLRTIKFRRSSKSQLQRAREQIVQQVRQLERSSEVLQNPISMSMTKMNSDRIGYYQSNGLIDGNRLFQHKGYYPIDLSKNNSPSLNSRIYLKAMSFLLQDVFDRLAAIDLVFLREDNAPNEILRSAKARQLYDALIEKYELSEFVNRFDEEKNRIFCNYRQIVDDIGATFKGVFLEVLLHNVMNPLKSVIAIHHADKISGRRLGAASTRFVVQYVKNQGRFLLTTSTGYASYPKELLPGKTVKATTTPIFHPRYGLVAIMCINIDVDAVSALDKKGIENFIEKFIATDGLVPPFKD